MRNTQCLDVAFTAQISIEKGLDLHSRGAIATADIRRYYDSINMVRFASFLIRKGCPLPLAIACLRVQMLPQVCLAVLGLNLHLACGHLVQSQGLDLLVL